MKGAYPYRNYDYETAVEGLIDVIELMVIPQ